MNKYYQEIIQEVSKDTEIPIEIVDKTYKAFWLYIKESIKKLPLKEDLNEEDFNSLKPNFNIPSLGKLYCTYSRYKGVKDKFNYIKEFRKKYEKID